MAYNEKSKEATLKYLKKMKPVTLRIKPELYEKHEAAAKKAGYPSMRKFYLDAIDEKIEKINNQ